MPWPLPARRRPEPARDFREQAVQEALDRVVGDYRPEKRLGKRLVRVAVVAAATLVTVLAYWAVLHHSTPRPAPKAAERKPIPVQLLPPPARP